MLSLDLRVALRTLAKRPLFAMIVVLTLSAGIGVTATVYSLIDALILRPLPFPDAENLVVPVTVERAQRIKRGPVAYRDYLEWRRQRDLFAGVALVDVGDYDLVAVGEPEKVEGAAVSADYFPILRSRPLLGRGLEPADFAPGAEKVVVLGEGLWQSRFGSRPDVLGTTLRLGDTVYEVVGVFAIEDASLLARHRLWIPLDLGFPVSEELMSADAFSFRAVARLRSGVALAEAQARLAALAERLARDEPDLRHGVEVEILPLREWLLKTEAQVAMLVILAAVFLVLMIVCFNIAGLLLVRAAARQKEFAIRLSLGAERRQLTRQMLIESALLALPGGAGGVLLAVWGMDLLRVIAPARLPLAHLGLNLSVLAFAAALSLFTAFAVGLLPALQVGRTQLSDFLRDSGSGAGSDRRLRRRQSLLVAGELAVTLVLLTLAGMAIRNITELLGREGGVAMTGRLGMEVELPEERYPEQARREAFYQGLLERVRSHPQVNAAAASSSLPLGGGGTRLRATFVPRGQPDPAPGEEQYAFAVVVTPDYFRATGTPQLRGRGFSERDAGGAPPVVVISQAMAEQVLAGQEAVGRHIRQIGAAEESYEIVGVVGDVRYRGLGDDWQPMVYFPYRQAATPPLEKLVVHAAGDPLALVGSIRAEVRALDPLLPVSQIRTFEQIAAESISASRYTYLVLSGLSACALILAAVGLYGIVSYSVAQRTQEFGVRLALGARRRDVLWLVVHQGLLLCLLGGAVGLLLAPLLGGGLAEVLVVGSSPVTYVAVVLVLALVVVLATLGPAWKAIRIAPAEALRYE
jgi:putative ABC transport system permease protein